MRYFPHTEAQIKRMLSVIGVDNLDELFSSIPTELRPKSAWNFPPALSESELLTTLQQLGKRNTPAGPDMPCFLGAGIHAHNIPAAVDSLASRGEFTTAYTPYQPELSQGTLTAIFEFQTMVCELFGTEYANASMYDGASATAEALLMALRLNGRSRALIAQSVHPEYVETCRTYLAGLAPDTSTELTTTSALEGVMIDDQGRIDLADLEQRLADDVHSVIVQSPNFFGVIEDLAPMSEIVHRAGALLVVVCAEPLALALIKPPGQCGADIVVGEGIGLAGPPNLGGPGVGLLGANGKKALRQMPGRLVGETVDDRGNTGYVLTLATREQHIRRDKATSNICTNHGLMALRMAIYLSLLGPEGFRSMAHYNLSKAAYARDAISATGVARPRFSAPTFNEVAMQFPGLDAGAVARAARNAGMVVGLPLGRFFPEFADTLLISVTERHSRSEIDRLARTLKSIARA